MRVAWTRQRTTVAAALLLGGMALAVYFPSLSGTFLNVDDPTYVTANPQLALPAGRAVETILTTPWFHNYTPLPRLTYLAEWKGFGADAMGFRGTNLLLHVAAAILVFLLLSKWLGRRLPAFLAAVLFVVHPSNVENVAWIAERNTLLAGTFTFGALLAWLSERRGTALALFVLALLSKSTVLGLPVLLVVLDATRKIRIRPGRYAPFFGASLLFGIVQVLAAHDGQGITALHGGTWFHQALTSIAALPSYAASLFWPFGQSPHHLFPAATSVSDPRVLGGVGILILLATATFFSVRRTGRMAVAAAWLLLTLATVLVVPIPVVFADRFLYLGMPLILGVLVAAALRPPGRLAMFAAGGVVAIAAVFGVSAHVYAACWRSPMPLWERNAARYPGDRLTWDYLGGLRLRIFDMKGAEAAYRKMLQVDPDYRDGWQRYAILLAASGRRKRAEQIFTRLLAKEPAEPSLWVNLAAIRSNARDPKGAREAFEAGLAHCPDSPLLRRNYADFLARIPHSERGNVDPRAAPSH